MTILLAEAFRERCRVYPGAAGVLALDLGNRMGWACRHLDGRVAHGHFDFTPGPREGWGWRFLRARRWLTDFKNAEGGLEALFYERVDFMPERNGPESVQVYGAFRGAVTGWCEAHRVPYEGIAVPTIKAYCGAKRGAKKEPIQAFVKGLGYSPKTTDEADALALLHLGLDKLEKGRAA